MNMMNIEPIGIVETSDELFLIRVFEQYKQGLTSIDGFSLLKIIWWADQTEEYAYDNRMLINKPYKSGPDKVGIFASRSQVRPNPICISTIRVKDVNQDAGTISTFFIDAFPGSPILDIKPYLPASDRARDVSVPLWCRHWPMDIESAAEFDWASEFNFPV